MVNPLYIIAAFMAVAFAVALFDKLGRGLSMFVVYLGITAIAAASGLRLWELTQNPDLGTHFFTAGFSVPLSIGLSFGFKEAILILIVNIMGLMGAVIFAGRFREDGAQPMALYLLMLLGANGLILTRDIFNAFVFLEILSIAGYALIGLRQTKNALASGLKYMMAGGISSAFLLIGIIFAYRYTGTLNLDMWAGLGAIPSAGYQVALFLILIALFIDLKPFPANGWALDVYQSAHGGLGAVLSSIHSTALLYLMYKLIPLLSAQMLLLFAIAGLVSFVMANLTGLRQKDAKRLLGYSSTAQTGLIIFVLYGMSNLGIPDQYSLIVALGFMLNNVLAKSGLFWLSEQVKGNRLTDWAVLRRDSGLIISFGVFTVALVGLPPFPGFFAKWELLRVLSTLDQPYWLAAILIGSLFEAVYMFRWLGIAAKEDTDCEASPASHKHFPVIVGVTLLFLSSYFIGTSIFELPWFTLIPVAGLLVFGLIDFVPAKLKGLLAIGFLAAYGWYMIWPFMPLMGKVFAVILTGGSLVQMIAFMNRKGSAEGLFPPLVMLVFSLANLLLASSRLELFIAWEFMTISSYLLILRGKNAQKPAQSYVIFSLGAAYLILTALMFMPEFVPGFPLLWQSGYYTIGIVPMVLGILGLLIKTGTLGFHAWLPGSYSEAEDDTTALISSVLSKAGIFGLVLFLSMGMRNLESGILMQIIGWLGVLTALFGAMMALYEEDVKRLLAYSSMSQVGYIVLGLSLMSHLGWVSAMYLSLNHLFFKALIFLAIAGVVMRTKTRNMYEMGGLIKKMPISYISVLMGIIAASGVPPLSGFGSKWFIYTSLLERGHYFQAAVAFFASAVAFLYLYKLIHTVFLGQAKPAQADVKEAPLWLIIPQGIFIMVIMTISMFPNYITKTVSDAVNEFIAKPEWLTWSGYTIHINAPNLRAYWDGNLIMYVTMGVFMVPLIWLLLVNAKAQKVKQFNIVFAAERPYKPWTTHFAFNMFAHYYKALGFMVKPHVTEFWNGVSEWAYSLSATVARIYTGNGQTYLLHIFMYTLVLFLFLGVSK